MKIELTGGTVTLTEDNGKAPADPSYQATVRRMTLDQYAKHARDTAFVQAAGPAHAGVMAAYTAELEAAVNAAIDKAGHA